MVALIESPAGRDEATPRRPSPPVVARIEGPAGHKEATLRRSTPPVIARIENDAVVIDLRTVDPAEEEALLAALRNLWRGAPA